MTKSNEFVTIAVVTFNSAELIEGLILSLPNGTAGVAYQLVVADNASTDETVSLVRRLAPTATVVQTGRNAGYAGGINAAVSAAAPHSALLVLNPDVRLSPGCLAELMLSLRQPRVGVAVPKLIDAQGDLILSIRREPSLARALGDAVVGAERAGRSHRFGEVASDPRQYANNHEIDWAEGSTQLISAECWSACGPWDESYFLYSEETDFDLRARDHGFQVMYVATAEATHLEGGSGTSPALWSLLVMNRIRLYRRRRGFFRSIGFWGAVLLRESSRAVLGKRTSRAAVRALVNPQRLLETPGPHSLR